MTLMDRPGVLARVARALGDHQISIQSMVQKSQKLGEYVPVIIITHEARDSQCTAAISAIDETDLVGAPTVRYRIEDFEQG